MYHDSTIGNAINIVLVRIMFLEEEEVSRSKCHYNRLLQYHMNSNFFSLNIEKFQFLCIISSVIFGLKKLVYI